MDPDLEWIRQMSFKQPEYMWIFQLEQVLFSSITFNSNLYFKGY